MELEPASENVPLRTFLLGVTGSLTCLGAGWLLLILYLEQAAGQGPGGRLITLWPLLGTLTSTRNPQADLMAFPSLVSDYVGYYVVGQYRAPPERCGRSRGLVVAAQPGNHHSLDNGVPFPESEYTDLDVSVFPGALVPRDIRDPAVQSARKEVLDDRARVGNAAKRVNTCLVLNTPSRSLPVTEGRLPSGLGAQLEKLVEREWEQQKISCNPDQFMPMEKQGYSTSQDGSSDPLAGAHAGSEAPVKSPRRIVVHLQNWGMVHGTASGADRPDRNVHGRPRRVSASARNVDLEASCAALGRSSAI